MRNERVAPSTKLAVPDLLSLLLTRFDGRPVVPFKEGLEAISYPVQTARNKRSCKTLTLPIIERGNRLYLDVVELAKFAGGGKRRGRKAKAEKFAEAGDEL